MANLLHAADKSKVPGGAKDEHEEFMMKLREEVVDKFSTDLGKLQAEIEKMRKGGRADEDEILKTIKEVH